MMISAKEAEERALRYDENTESEPTPNLKEFEEFVLSRSEFGYLESNYNGELTEDELVYLLAFGYWITYNHEHKWFDVSWES